MEERILSQKALDILLKSQADEETDSLIYDFMSKKEKDPKNKKILEKMASDEKDHAEMWKSFTKKNVKPNHKLIYWYKFLTVIMGFTFVLKLIQSDETSASSKYADIINEVPEAKKASEDELRHEHELIEMLDEERLQYVGAMVLGLNDALVELTGTIAGLSFALMNTRIVALSGIITGISATLSMAASNYLAERAENNPNAMKSSIYTGVAYLITVALLVLPYLIFPEDMWLGALITMLATVIFIILFFNYYISVAKDLPFMKRFLEMAGISLSVAAISFLIGILVKKFLGIDL
ncbi:VIT1/CCC1 transporter family protein [Fusobacterium sp.]|uniref:VIT1/CCC1 transporter family protein n=1 Tax=Fusobacterium sp. TaxID=68766 RepID=UPI0029028287|nr:VIT1/CCC1 transporter family protein [Fusobacterium sp.]MDU1910994.1 VIT1/CCC1 transporter family protein [Fusobacterium sp.]